MRRFLLTILAVIAVAIVAVFVLVPLLVDKEQILALASSTLEEQTGAKLVVNGDANLSVFPKIGRSRRVIVERIDRFKRFQPVSGRMPQRLIHV